MRGAGQERVVAALRQVLATRERERAPVRIQRMVGRASDGAVLQQRLDAECITRGAPANTYAGETYADTSPAGARITREGTAGVAGVEEQVGGSVLWVESLDPNVFQPGESYTVTVRGRGFVEGLRFEFLRPGFVREVNEDLEILSSLFVNATTFELQVSVSGGALLYPDRAPLGYDRPGGAG